MTHAEIDMNPLQGALNTNYITTSSDGGLLIERVPYENLIIHDSLAHEYAAIGFTKLGGNYRRRTPEEQVLFADYAAKEGLQVLPPVVMVKDASYYQFLPDVVTLDTYLADASSEQAVGIMLGLFQDLRRAHDKGIVYGDRWSKNILITRNGGFLHIDFDLELMGPPAKTFEVAQLAYYILCGGKEKVLQPLAVILSHNKDWYNQDWLERFLRGHARHFTKSVNYGGIEAETDALIELLRKERERF